MAPMRRSIISSSMLPIELDGYAPVVLKAFFVALAFPYTGDVTRIPFARYLFVFPDKSNQGRDGFGKPVFCIF